jgi:hypothetical protein
MAKTRRSNLGKHHKHGKKGGKTRKGTGGKKGTPWTAFVKKIYAEMKRKNPDAKLGDAMKAASKRKAEM